MAAVISNWRTDPYRLLFPIGYAFLAIGLGVWSVDLLAGIPHKETLHALILGNGFLFAFAMGILLSECPRAVDAPPAGWSLIGFFILCLAGMGAAALSGHFQAAYLFHLASTAALGAFLWRRLPRGSGSRHPGIAIAFTAVLFSAAWTALGLASESGAFPLVLGREAALSGLQGFFLMFCMACLRWNWDPAFRSGPMRIWPSALLLALSLGAEVSSLFALHPRVWLINAYALRILWIAIYLRLPPGYGTLFDKLPPYGILMRAGAFSILAGTAAAAFFPGLSLTFNHFTFVAGFAWIALIAATGVIAQRLEPARRRSGAWLAAAGGLALGASVAVRGTAMSWTERGYVLLPIAAALALLPLLIWAIVFFPRLATGRER
ncbi:MAG: NnrS family protein [Fibrobacteria bacterium]